jgi:hypothetical protein
MNIYFTCNINQLSAPYIRHFQIFHTYKVLYSKNDDAQPIDVAIAKIKNTNFANFSKKWSGHKHDDINCNKTITIDGNWKLYRAKCCFEGVAFNTEEFGPIFIGCPETPAVKSYYCDKHSSQSLALRIGNNIKQFRPNKIQISKTSIQ